LRSSFGAVSLEPTAPLGRFWWYVIFLLLSNLEHKNDSHRLLRKLLQVAPSKAGATLEFKTDLCHSHRSLELLSPRMGAWSGVLEWESCFDLCPD
jgi:hypothetical protein